MRSKLESSISVTNLTLIGKIGNVIASLIAANRSKFTGVNSPLDSVAVTEGVARVFR